MMQGRGDNEGEGQGEVKGAGRRSKGGKIADEFDVTVILR